MGNRNACGIHTYIQTKPYKIINNKYFKNLIPILALAYLRKILEANLETVLAAFVLFYFILFFNENLSLKLKNNASGKI